VLVARERGCHQPRQQIKSDLEIDDRKLNSRFTATNVPCGPQVGDCPGKRAQDHLSIVARHASACTLARESHRLYADCLFDKRPADAQWIVAFTVMIDVPEPYGPSPVPWMANVSLPL
jgi:hypothetical protein